MAETSLRTQGAGMTLPGFGQLTRIRIATLLLVWLSYEALARSGLLFEGVVPSSFAVLGSMAQTLAEPSFYPHLARTGMQVIMGFLLGSSIGLVTGIIFGMSAFVGRMLNPWVHSLAPAPKIIFLPILMLLFGVDWGSKVAMATISAFFPVAVATYAAMLHVKPIYVRVARIFNASLFQMVTKVYVPSLIGPVMTSLRLSLGVAYIGTLLAEIKLSNMGLGYLVIQHYNFMRISDMYGVLLITFAIAIAANSFMGWLAGRVEHDR